MRARYLERRAEIAKLGPRIAALRRAFGFTQEQLARAMGTSKSNISALEHGRAPGITVERLLALLEALGIGHGSESPGGTGAGDGFPPTAPIRRPEDAVAAG